MKRQGIAKVITIDPEVDMIVRNLMAIHSIVVETFHINHKHKRGPHGGTTQKGRGS